MKLNKRFEFSFKLLILIVLISFLLFDFFIQVYYPKDVLAGLRTIDRLEVYYAFFTTQSNYCVVIFLFITLLLKKVYSSKPAFGLNLALTVYITITMIVFWTGLLTSSNEAKAYKFVHWISTTVLHLVIPVAMIFNFFLTVGDQYYSYRKHTKFSVFAIAFYPIGYLIFSMIRGHFKYEAYGPNEFSKIFQSPGESLWGPEMGTGFGITTTPYTNQLWYPYWFMDMHSYKLNYGDGTTFIDHTTIPQSMMILIFVVACFGIALLTFGLQYLYLWHNNEKYWRWHNIEGELLTFNEHKEKLIKRKVFKKINRISEYQKNITIKSEIKLLKSKLKTFEVDSDEYKKILDEIKNKKLELRNKEEIASIKYNELMNKKEIKKFLNTLTEERRIWTINQIRESKRVNKVVQQEQNIESAIKNLVSEE